LNKILKIWSHQSYSFIEMGLTFSSWRKIHFKKKNLFYFFILSHPSHCLSQQQKEKEEEKSVTSGEG
jgi:hypothetical protein